MIIGVFSGIGEVIVKVFVCEGVVVVLVVCCEGVLCWVVWEIEVVGGWVMVVLFDVLLLESVCVMVVDVVGEFGCIDVVFNNVGVLLVGLVDVEIFFDDICEMLEIDYFGMVCVVWEVLLIMK